MNTQQICDRARITLNDDDKTRWSDAELLGHLNDFLDVGKLRHPEWFFGLYSALPVDLVIGAAWPINQMFAVAAQHYVVARAHMKDIEEAFDGAVGSMMQLVDAST